MGRAPYINGMLSAMRRALLVLLLALGVIAAACATVELDVELPTPQTPIPSPSPAGEDPYGTGIDGDLTVSTTVTLNTCHQIGATTGSSLNIVSAGFLPGRLLLVMQVRGTTTSAGGFELARVQSVGASTVVVDEPLSRPYSSGGGVPRAQACTVPEFESLAVLDGGALQAAKWNGTSGGVLAFLVSSSFTVSGTGALSADGAGFRGGTCNLNSAGDSGPADSASGGEKGERIAGSGGNGRSPVANGGGGGNPRLSGAGGGGGGGPGGAGGDSPSLEATGGEGGAVLDASGPRLYLGGGGGGGHGLPDGEIESCDGAPGGGVIFLQAARALGSGVLRANGRSPGAPGGLLEASAGGGGGGGGMVWAVVGTDAGFSPIVSVNGGRGGDGATSTIDVAWGAGGGGGGGGWTRLQGFAADEVRREGAPGGAGTNEGLKGGDGVSF